MKISEEEDPLKPRISVLVTDLDNTLWDWVKIWHASFASLINVLTDGGLDRETLLDEASEIHQRHGTSEYALLLDELPSVRELGDGADATALREAAILASQEARKEALVLYPGVKETLASIRGSGALVVAYTESMAFATAQRVRKLGLDGVIQFLYSSPDHDFPEDAPAKAIRRHDDDYYALKGTEHRNVARGVLKPSADVLRQILKEVEAVEHTTAYVGDNLMKDVVMAKEAGVLDVLAAYGAPQDREDYQLLRRVTHWPETDVARERRMLADGKIEATFRLEDGFAELNNLFSFVKPG